MNHHIMSFYRVPATPTYLFLCLRQYLPRHVSFITVIYTNLHTLIKKAYVDDHVWLIKYFNIYSYANLAIKNGSTNTIRLLMKRRKLDIAESLLRSIKYDQYEIFKCIIAGFNKKNQFFLDTLLYYVISKGASIRFVKHLIKYGATTKSDYYVTIVALFQRDDPEIFMYLHNDIKKHVNPAKITQLIEEYSSHRISEYLRTIEKN